MNETLSKLHFIARTGTKQRRRRRWRLLRNWLSTFSRSILTIFLLELNMYAGGAAVQCVVCVCVCVRRRERLKRINDNSWVFERGSLIMQISLLALPHRWWLMDFLCRFVYHEFNMSMPNACCQSMYALRVCVGLSRYIVKCGRLIEHFGCKTHDAKPTENA